MGMLSGEFFAGPLLHFLLTPKPRSKQQILVSWLPSLLEPSCCVALAKDTIYGLLSPLRLCPSAYLSHCHFEHLWPPLLSHCLPATAPELLLCSFPGQQLPVTCSRVPLCSRKPPPAKPCFLPFFFFFFLKKVHCECLVRCLLFFLSEEECMLGKFPGGRLAEPGSPSD